MESGPLRIAARAAIVMPAVFAVADKAIGDPQTALFAAFGSFAMLVFVDFTGPPRTRLVAFLTLAALGAVNIVLGTLCSQSAWLAPVAMGVVAFAILVSGAINPYLAAASYSLLLTFILPVTLSAPASVIPARLEGWALAAAAGICAQMLLWPARPRDTLRADAAHACAAVADLADSTLGPDRSTARDDLARDAVDAVRNRLLATPHRPTQASAAALAALVEELDWLLPFLVAPAGSPALEPGGNENAQAMAASISVLRACAASLRGAAERPDLVPLDQAEEAVTRALARQLAELNDSELRSAFRVRSISRTARRIAGLALVDGSDFVRRESAERRARSALRATKAFAVQHVGARSVWFRNGVRGAVGLAIAVYIAQRTGLQHDFWIVLGTLSVLRSNALGIGTSILSALAGTAVGILIGAATVVAIGTHELVLWIVLPVAILLAAYAPRAISFAAGQSGFTVVLFVLFNLIQPVGWGVGLIRVEDVAIGFAISLGVGLLLWPRGAEAVLRENLAAAYARSADYVEAAARRLIEGGDVARTDAASQAAAAAVHRLDDAYRQHVAERSARHLTVGAAGSLVVGVGRVRHAGQAIAELARPTESLSRCALNLEREVQALHAWLVALGNSIVQSTPVPPPPVRDAEGRRRLLECVRTAVARGDEADRVPTLSLLWASAQLDDLRRLESDLGA
jgi:uncharacterized membrane protein YccC